MVDARTSGYTCVGPLEGRKVTVVDQGNPIYGYEPFEFDENDQCTLEARELQYAILTRTTWLSHSTSHEGESRAYFAEFRENREAIIATLKLPLVLRRLENRFGFTYSYQSKQILAMRLKDQIEVRRQHILVVKVDGNNNRILTFFPTKKIEIRGELLYP